MVNPTKKHSLEGQSHKERVVGGSDVCSLCKRIEAYRPLACGMCVLSIHDRAVLKEYD